MLTIMKDVFEDADDEVVVEIDEDQFDKYHVRVFVSFQQTKHFEFDNKKEAKKKFYEIVD